MVVVEEVGPGIGLDGALDEDHGALGSIAAELDEPQ